MITVYGSINLDLVSAVDHFPAAGETVLTPSCLLAPGGKGANQAVAAALAGGAVTMSGAVGADGFAAIAMQGFSRAGVETRHIAVLPDQATALANVMVDAGGENRIVVASNANGAVPPLAPEAVAEGGLLLLQMEVPQSRIEEALDLCAARGGRGILNLAPFAPVGPALLAKVDILVVNAGEAAALSAHLGIGTDGPKEQLDALSRFCRSVVITLGSDGYLCAAGQERFEGAALPVEVADTTGAGDAFCGCFAAALDAGLPMRQALRFASAGASLACRSLGAQSAYATKAEINAAIG